MSAAGVALARTGRQAAVRKPDFRVLVGEAAWAELPPAVGARFAADDERTYPGTMQVRASPFGALIAHLCRLVGTPVAPWTGEAVAVSVRVWTDDDGALVWDRTYAFAGRAPLLVSSRKLVNRKGELMEVARGGLGMRLAATVEAGVLHFRSTGYFWRLWGVCLPIPDLVTPGDADVIHRDEGGGRFTFAMRFVHPLAGETLFQSGIYEDPS
jgi:hypothetical protein